MFDDDDDDDDDTHIELFLQLHEHSIWYYIKLDVLWIEMLYNTLLHLNSRIKGSKELISNEDIWDRMPVQQMHVGYFSSLISFAVLDTSLCH